MWDAPAEMLGRSTSSGHTTATACAAAVLDRNPPGLLTAKRSDPHDSIACHVRLSLVVERSRRAVVDLGTAANSPRAMGTDPRPVAVPDDVDDPRHEKASGVEQLPSNVRWSGPPKTYDLNDPIDRARLYEQVLREGMDDDVRRFIDVDELETL